MSAVATTIALTPFSEAREGVILIGANCLDRPAGSPKLPLKIVSPYASHDDIERAASYCWDVSIGICAELGEQLNEHLGIKEDAQYWQCILMPWAFAWVENAYDRYLRLKWVRDNVQNPIFELPRLEIPHSLYLKSFDVWGQSHLHSTNIVLYRLLLEGLGMEAQVRAVGYGPEHADNSTKGRTLFGLAGSIRRKARTLWPRAWQSWSEYTDDMVRDDGFEEKALDRAALRLKASNEEFRNLVGAIVSHAIPRSLVEEHHSRREFAKKFVADNAIRIFPVSTAIWSNDSVKYVVAGVRKAGGRVIGRQHGGGYGFFEVAGPERVERHLSDIFITWGWKDDRGCRTLPLPDQRLSEEVNPCPPRSDDILYVGTHGPMYMFRYQSYWIPEFVHSRFEPMQGIFFAALGDRIKQRIVYRLYPKEYGWREKERISRFLPEVRFDVSGTAIDSLKRCALVVLDHPATTLLEAMALNTPVVAFWDFAQTPMRSEAQPYFDRMIAAGIVHATPEAAAAKVNAIAGDPQKWWTGALVQETRRDFCRRFAWTDQDWKSLWDKALAPEREKQA